MYHFMAGYTAALAGTEANMGKDPTPTFSTCFGAPFLPLPPQTYAQMLAEKMRKHKVHCYLLNSGWVGNAFGQGPRISLKINRDNVTHIIDGTLDKAQFHKDPTFGFEVPKALPGIPAELLAPRYGAKDAADYDRRAKDLAAKFVKNFEQFQGVSAEIIAAGPEGVTDVWGQRLFTKRHVTTACADAVIVGYPASSCRKPPRAPRIIWSASTN